MPLGVARSPQRTGLMAVSRRGRPPGPVGFSSEVDTMVFRLTTGHAAQFLLSWKWSWTGVATRSRCLQLGLTQHLPEPRDVKTLQQGMGSGLGHVAGFFRVPVSAQPSPVGRMAAGEAGAGIHGTERSSPLPRATQ